MVQWVVLLASHLADLGLILHILYDPSRNARSAEPGVTPEHLWV